MILISTLTLNALGMAVYSYVPRYLFDYLNIDITSIQLIVTIFPLTWFVFPPILGKLSDKIQNRFVFMIFGAVGLLITFILLMFTINLVLIIILLLSFGLFSASSSINLVLFQEYVENDQIYISYYNAMVVLGWFIGAFVFGIIIDLYSIESIFQFLLIFSIINLIIVIFIREKRALITERQIRDTNAKEEENLLNNDEESSPISKSIYGSLFFRNFGIRPIISVLSIIMIVHLSTNTEIGFLIGINPLISFFLIILMGRIIKDKNIKFFMICGYLLSVIVIIGYIFSSDFFGYLLCQILISFSFSMFWTATQVYIAKNTTPENKGKYTGYVTSSFYLGSFMGGLFFSLLLFTYSDYYIAMWFMIIFPGVSAIIILLKFDKIEKL